MVGKGSRRGGGICIILPRKGEVSGLGGGQEVCRWLELGIQVVLLLALVMELRIKLRMLILLL